MRYFGNVEGLENRVFFAAGTLDATFGAGGIVRGTPGATSVINDVVVLSDGKILSVGEGVGGSTGKDFAIARYNANGSVDTSFGGGDGMVSVDIMTAAGYPHERDDDVARNVVIQSGGRIVVMVDAKEHFGWGLAAFTSEGELDSTFANDSGLYWRGDMWKDHEGDVLLAPDDSLYVSITSGNYQRPYLAMYHVLANGKTDTPWGTGGGEIYPMFDADYSWSLDAALQSDGKIVQAGCIDGMFALVRYNSDGSVDSSFGSGGIVATSLGGMTDMPDAAYAIAMTADGKAILAGTHAGGYQAALARFDLSDDGHGVRPAWPVIVSDVQAITMNDHGLLRVVGTDGFDYIFIDGDLAADDWRVYCGLNGTPFKLSGGDVEINAIVINGMGGNDKIVIQADFPLGVSISGGAGNDRIFAGGGNDSITGNTGKDYIDAGAGNDRLSGGGGHDALVGNVGDDRLIGMAGMDRLEAGNGSDRIYAGNGDDILAGGAGSDTMYGEAGRDTIVGGTGTDHALDANGMDTVINATPASLAAMPPLHLAALMFDANAEQHSDELSEVVG